MLEVPVIIITSLIDIERKVAGVEHGTNNSLAGPADNAGAGTCQLAPCDAQNQPQYVQRQAADTLMPESGECINRKRETA